jgi:DNA-binding response OmpR family regulator
MKKINNIAVFCNDKFILALLKGYCYANNINLIVVDFNLNGINEAARQKPDLILVQLDWVIVDNKIETTLLRRVAAYDLIKICCLNTNLNHITAPELSEWIDEIIDNPFDIEEIAGYFKKSFLNTCLSENNRRHKERRNNAGRRNFELNYKDGDGYRAPINRDYQHEVSAPEFINFNIDQRDKCVLINGDKVYLTPKEFELVEFLISDIDRVFKNDEIINQLWPENHRATKSDLYQYMYLLRKKIEKAPNSPQFIMTVRGFGYKLNKVYLKGKYN